MPDPPTLRDRPRIRFRFDDVERGLAGEEATALSDLLWKERAFAARELAARIDAESAKNEPETIALGATDLTALRELLGNTDVGESAGLTLLKQTVCGPAFESG